MGGGAREGGHWAGLQRTGRKGCCGRESHRVQGRPRTPAFPLGSEGGDSHCSEGQRSFVGPRVENHCLLAVLFQRWSNDVQRGPVTIPASQSFQVAEVRFPTQPSLLPSPDPLTLTRLLCSQVPGGSPTGTLNPPREAHPSDSSKTYLNQEKTPLSISGMGQGGCPTSAPAGPPASKQVTHLLAFLALPAQRNN